MLDVFDIYGAVANLLVNHWPNAFKRITKNIRWKQAFIYLIGVFFIFTLSQYGINIYAYMQYQTRFSYKSSSDTLGSMKDENYDNRDEPYTGYSGVGLLMGRKFQQINELNVEFHETTDEITDPNQNVSSSNYSSVHLVDWFISNIKELFALPTPPPTQPLPLCRKGPRRTAGMIYVRQRHYTEERLGSRFINMTTGGRWRPKKCTSRYKVAIIVPYRDRVRELGIFLRHMHPFLQRQNLDYAIYIIEQTSNSMFNRGLLMNIGFKEAMTRDDYACVVLHDVDMLPEDDRILYDCPAQPRHLSAAGSRWHYKYDGEKQAY